MISTIVVGLVLAFIFGALVQRVRVSPLVGHLLAGVVMGGRSRRVSSPTSTSPTNWPRSRAMLTQIAGAAPRPESRPVADAGMPPDSNPRQDDGGAPSTA